jgi:hypothetical protein
VSPVSARARACSIWCTRIVPAPRCLFAQPATTAPEAPPLSRSRSHPALDSSREQRGEEHGRTPVRGVLGHATGQSPRGVHY